jgi:uncharacterized protein YoxC
MLVLIVDQPVKEPIKASVKLVAIKDIHDVLYEADEVPHVVHDVPDEAEELSHVIHEVLHKAEEVPRVIREVPHETEEVPPKAGEFLRDVRDALDGVEDVPQAFRGLRNSVPDLRNVTGESLDSQKCP